MLRVAMGQGVGSRRGIDAEGIRHNGAVIRGLIADAAAAGARLVVFTEGALSYPTKRAISADPDRVTVADWSRYAWAAVESELAAIVRAAREHGIWVAVGCLTAQPPPGQPLNSLVVIDDHGGIVGRYNKRHLAPNEERIYQLASGREPLTFTIDGVRFGCLICIEAMLPDLTIEYEELGADALVLADIGDGPSRSNEDKRALALAEIADLWIFKATSANQPGWQWSSAAAPGFRWLARGTQDGQPGIVVADLDHDDARVRLGRDHGRPWRQRQRAVRLADGLP